MLFLPLNEYELNFAIPNLSLIYICKTVFLPQNKIFNLYVCIEFTEYVYIVAKMVLNVGIKAFWYIMYTYLAFLYKQRIYVFKHVV